MEPDASCVENINEAFSRTWQKMKDPLVSKLRIYLNGIASISYELTADMQQVNFISFFVLLGVGKIFGKFRFLRKFSISQSTVYQRI